MNKQQAYNSDSDESDEDFRPEDLAGESPVSEDEAEDSETNEGLNEESLELKTKSVKRKRLAKKVKTQKTKNDESDDDAVTSRRTTRLRDDVRNNGKGKSLEKDELVSDEEDKSRTNALWADFLKDVKTTPTFSELNTTKVENKPSSSSNNVKEPCEKNKNEIHRKNGLTSKVEENKIVVTEVVDFAGEEISVQREIDASSIKENKAASVSLAKNPPFSRIAPGVGIKRTVSTAATGSSSGLGSILNQLGKKKKLSVLEKSQMDWKSFKQSEGIDEQLQTFNKGKDGYLERQDFLQRTDLRQFEIEKNLRQSTRRPF